MKHIITAALLLFTTVAHADEDCMLDQYEDPTTVEEIIELAEMCNENYVDWLEDYK